MQLVHINKIMPGMMVGQDIGANPDNSGAPLVRRHTVLTSSLIDLMEQHKISFAYILNQWEKDAIMAKNAHRIEVPQQIYVPQSKPTVSKELRKNALQHLEDLFSVAHDQTKSAIQVVKHLDEVAEQLADSLMEDSRALVNINDLKSYDEYTYHHSLSVAVLAMAVAQGMGYSKEVLTRIAKCGLMHDIGKTTVPISIINKPSRLEPEEFSAIQQHPPAGFDYLVSQAIGDEEIWLGVLYHHEKPDGTGYPRGLKQNAIPLWSRIISVADVYDALTSNRPYRRPAQPAEAVEYIMGGVGSSFDYDVVTAFLAKLELYPIGSKVRLSNGQIALVYNNENAMRPVVRVIPTGEMVDLYRDRQCLSLVITELLED